MARPSGEAETLEVGLAITAAGFAADRIPGVPFDEKERTVANVEGRVVDPGSGRVVPSEYVVGWARTGAKGLIGSHRSGSADVVALMLRDWRSGSVAPLERPPREKVADVQAMFDLLADPGRRIE